MAAQNHAVRETNGEILAFTDAATDWAPDALRKLVRSFADPEVAYVTGGHVYRAADGTNREGTYWKYETGCARASPGSARSRVGSARSMQCAGRTTSTSTRASATTSPSRT